MALWDSGDPRYRDARRGVFLSIIGILVVGGGLYFLFSSKGDQTPARPPVAPVFAPIAPIAVAPVAPIVAATPQPTPASAPLPDPVAIQSEKLRGLHAALSRSRDLRQVDALTLEILEMEPEDGEAWSYRGRLYEKKGDFSQAMEAYEKAIASPSRTHYFYYLKACLYRKQGNYAEALQCLEAARELKTDSVVIPNMILIFQIQSGQAEAVRAMVDGFEKLGVKANVDRWQLGAVALAMHDNDKTKAAWLLDRFRRQVRPEIFEVLLKDPYFDPYRGDAQYLRFFLPVTASN